MKSDLEEGGIRVPGIIEWPARIRKPRISHVPCGTVDIYPTLVEIARASVANQVQPLDGISLVPLIDGRMERRDSPMGFWAYPEPGVGVNSTKVLEQLALEQSGEAPAQAPPPDPGIITKRYPEDTLPGPAAWIDGDYKLHRKAPKQGEVTYTLFDLARDSREKSDIAARAPQRTARMKTELEAWQKSVVRSLNGEDYR
jgi:arylsulfatase A-like enzyme